MLIFVALKHVTKCERILWISNVTLLGFVPKKQGMWQRLLQICHSHSHLFVAERKQTVVWPIFHPANHKFGLPLLGKLHHDKGCHKDSHSLANILSSEHIPSGHCPCVVFVQIPQTQHWSCVLGQGWAAEILTWGLPHLFLPPHP